MEEVVVLLIFVDFYIPCFEETLMWYFIGFVNFLSRLHDVFMWMVNDVFHVIFESKESRFCWGINVATEAHGEILNIIESLDIYVHESTNQVIN